MPARHHLPSGRARHARLDSPRRVLAAIALAAIVLAALPATALAGWAVMAVDPATRTIAIGVASCETSRQEARVSVLPGKVGGAVLGFAGPETEGLRLLRSHLETGNVPAEVVRQLQEIAGDRYVERRAYLVATADGSSTVHVGKELKEWSGGRSTGLESAIGEHLDGAGVVEGPLKVMEQARIAGEPVYDRVAKGLAASSTAGGDARCNRGGVRQTAAAAAIVVVRGDDGAFHGKPSTKHPPYLLISKRVRTTRKNAVAEVLDAYSEWRAKHGRKGQRPTFEDVPDGRTLARPVATGASRGPLTIAAIVVLLLAGAGLVVLGLGLREWWSTRGLHDFDELGGGDDVA